MSLFTQSKLEARSALHQRAEELRDRLYAVHATSYFPVDGVIKARASNGGGRSLEEPASFRPTIHFSLGELVRSDPDRKEDWDDKDYAIILPVRSIEQQLVNINPYDSIVLGDFKLPPEAIFVVLKSKVHLVPPGFKYVTHGGKTTLRQAVDHVISEQGGWKIQMRNTTEPLESALLDGENINTKEFFEPLLRENPRLSFGTHLSSQVGEIYRLGYIDQTLYHLMKPFNPLGRVRSFDEMIFLEGFIRHHLERLDRFIDSAGFPREAYLHYRAKRQTVLDWLNIIEMEKLANQRLDLTLTQPDEAVFKKLKALKGNPEKLREYVGSLVGQRKLKPMSASEGFVDPEVLSGYLTGTVISEVIELLEQYPYALNSTHVNLFWSQYAVGRILAVSELQAQQEKLFERLNISARFANPWEGKKIAESLFSILESTLNPSSTRLGLALKILSMPSVRKLLQTHLGMRIGERPTLIDILKNHPKTNGIFEATTFASAPVSAGDVAAERLFALFQSIDQKSLNLKGQPPRRPVQSDIRSMSFAEAMIQSKTLRSSQQAKRKSIGELMLPLASIPPIDELEMGDTMTIQHRIQRGDVGTLDELMRELGLSDRFRQAFPSDRNFWTSRKSLVQIYQELSRPKE